MTRREAQRAVKKMLSEDDGSYGWTPFGVRSWSGGPIQCYEVTPAGEVTVGSWDEDFAVYRPHYKVNADNFRPTGKVMK
jgi:hypothetical protein